MLEERLVSEGMNAAATGSIGAFGALIDGLDTAIQTAVITASTAGQLHVELEKLTEFYNALSTLHDHLTAKLRTVMAQTQRHVSSNAAGHVPGVQKAWRAILESAGAGDQPHSLQMNLVALDQKVLHHMASLLDNAQQYAAQESRAIAEFGRVTAGVGGRTASPSGSGSSAW